MSFRLSPTDARRGGLVILGARHDEGREAARDYAGVGYETIVADEQDSVETLVAELAPPVFVLAFPAAAASAWTVTGVAAASIIADARIASVASQPPGVPAILHLETPAHATLADALETTQPDLPVHRLDTTPDGERLLLLRTLKLFSTHAGGRGEV